MRSLALKLTLAFLLVGVIGVVLFAVLAAQRTRAEFDSFLSDRDRDVLVNALQDYHATHGNWDGIGQTLTGRKQLDLYSRNATLTDAKRVVVFSRAAHRLGQTLPDADLDESTPIEVNGQTAGYLHLPTPGGKPDGAASPEAGFFQRVGWAAAASAGIAALIALVLGGVLARTLTRPIRELTAATQAMASGKLDQRVVVRSQDEIGALATSFNQMSSDLARASQLRKQMTADLAHDLRTPLSILRGYTEGLKEGRLNGTPAIYDIMYGEIEHLQRLIEDLRVLSLADAGALSLNKRMVDPAALLERTGLAYFVQAEQQGIALRVEPAEELPSISIDTDRMTQVLNNLVTNALKHTQHGEIVLGASAKDSKVYLTVRDTGAGIAAESLPFVFDRFYRADAARQRTDEDSSGLGLAIAKAIVEAHGGSIAVASVVGQGTTFTIALPSVTR